MIQEHAYFLRRGADIEGPVAFSDLRLGLLKGQIALPLEVRRDDEETFTSPDELPEFADLFREPPSSFVTAPATPRSKARDPER